MGSKTGKNYKSSKSKRPASKKKQDFRSKDEKEEVSTGGSSTTKYDDIRSNDIEWWNKSPLYADANRIPFNRLYGSPIVMPDYQLDPVQTEVKVTGNKAAVPGIMTINYLPNVGYTDADSNSAVNRAFTSLYGNLYAQTTGTPPITQADLALFMTSFSNIAGLIGHAKRILGVSQLYDSRNYYFPKALLLSLGVDPKDVIGKQDLLRMELNDYIQSFNNLCIPDFMSIYRRQYALAHNVYADEDSVESSLFVFRPAYYYKYVDTEMKLQCIELGSGMTVLMNAINTCLQAWRNSSDLGLIAGTIQRGFKDANFITLDYSVSGDVVIPVVDRNITWQINNCLATQLNNTTLDVTQDVLANALVFKPKGLSTSMYEDYIKSRGIYFLNSYDGDTSEEFCMEATRLLNVYDPVTYEMTFCTTEIVTSYQIWYYDINYDGELVLGQTPKFSNVFLFSKQNDAYSNYLRTLTLLTKFKHAPRLYLGYSDAPEQGVDYTTDLGFIGDLYKFTTVDFSVLEGLNRCALQSVYQTNVI